MWDRQGGACRVGLGLIVALALGSRLVLVAVAPVPRFAADPKAYDRIAQNLAAGDGYTRQPVRPGSSVLTPTAVHPPAWPIVLALGYALTDRPDTGQGRLAPTPARAAARWQVGRVINAGLGAAIVALIAVVAYELWGARLALVAGLAAALYPPLAILGLTLFSEPLFVAFELAAAYAALRWRRRRRRGLIVLSGLFVGLTMLTRANGAVLLVAVLTVAPWTIRNALVFPAFVPGSPIRDDPAARMARHGESMTRRRDSRGRSRPLQVRDRALPRTDPPRLELHRAPAVVGRAGRRREHVADVRAGRQKPPRTRCRVALALPGEDQRLGLRRDGRARVSRVHQHARGGWGRRGCG